LGVRFDIMSETVAPLRASALTLCQRRSREAKRRTPQP